MADIQTNLIFIRRSYVPEQTETKEIQGDRIEVLPMKCALNLSEEGLSKSKA